MKRVSFTSLLMAVILGLLAQMLCSIGIIVWPVWAIVSSGAWMGLAFWFLWRTYDEY